MAAPGCRKGKPLGKLHGTSENHFLGWAVVNPRSVFPQVGTCSDLGPSNSYQLRRKSSSAEQGGLGQNIQLFSLPITKEEMLTQPCSGERDRRARKEGGKGRPDAEKH